MRLPLFAALLLATAAAAPLNAQVQAQQPALDTRVGKLEREMRAVQRKVFPGGDSRYFEAEIVPPQPAADAPPPGVPASNPITDLTGRVGALETSLQQLTGQVEQQGFKLRQLEEAIAKIRGDTDYRLGVLEGGAPKPAAGAAPGLAPAPSAGTIPAPAPATAAPAQAPAPRPAAPAATTPAKPATPAPTAAATPQPAVPAGDPAEAAYSAAYRLWTDKKFVEAQAALRDVVAKYPKHRRASFAQNLLGRAYLDDGKPAAAAEAFYANYQKMPRGERAAESLFYLGQSLVQLKKPKDACRVYDELSDVYGATMGAALKDRVTKARAEAKCAA